MNRVKKGLAGLLVGAVGFGTYLGINDLVGNARFAQAEEQVQASREQLKHLDDQAAVYRAVGKAIEPSVVSIEVHKTVKGVRRMLPFDDDTLKRFFPDRDGDGEPDLPRGHRFNLPNDGSDEMEQVAGGSGVIMEVADGAGYILTNNHVAGGAESMTITLADGRKIKKAKVLGTDPKTDLAVIKIEADKLIAAPWGDSDTLAKGDIIFAFGSPFGYIGSMTHGIVSALNRQNIGILHSQFAYENFIQVDAPINPGNSGGPLVNLHGEVVGINTAIATETGAFNGIGFAIPSNMAKAVYDQLKDAGKVVRGYLGVQIMDASLSPKMMKSKFHYSGDNGVFVQDMLPDSPASGGLERGDIITAINGKAVKDSSELRQKVAATKPGSTVTFTVSREGKSQDVKVKLGEQPDDLVTARNNANNDKDNDNNSAAQTSAKSLGLHLSNPSDEIRSQYQLDDNVKGAVVTAVDPRSAAARALIQPGDVITQVGDDKVENSRQALDALGKQKLSDGILLSITNARGSRFVMLGEEEK
jgi:serine protease Do